MHATHMHAVYMCATHTNATHMHATHIYAIPMRATLMFATLICFFVAMIKHMTTQNKCGEEMIYLSCRLQLITGESQSRNLKGGKPKMEVIEEFLLTTLLPMAGSTCLPI